MKYRYLALILAALAVPAAAQNEGVLTPAEETAYREACGLAGETRDDVAADRAALAASVFFESAAQVAAETISAYCGGGVRDVGALYAGILNVVQAAASDSIDHGIVWLVDESADEVDLGRMSKELASAAVPGVSIPNIAFTNAILGMSDSKLQMEQFTVTPEDQGDCDRAVSAMIQNRTCDDYLEELYVIYKQTHALFSSRAAVTAALALDALDKQWTAFADATLDQTPWELAWNGRQFRNEHKGKRRFVPPPKSQTILLHPYVALDYTDGALDGSQLQAAVVMDIYGKRKIERGSWFMPSGWAVHTAYSDRAEVEDWGFGLSLHFDRRNSIGITLYGDEIGINFSYDLWETAKGTNDRLKGYRSMAEEMLADPLGQ